MLSQLTGQWCCADLAFAASEIELTPAATNHERVLARSQELEFL